jgi:hypothetical protein
MFYSSDKGFYSPTSFSVTSPSAAEFGGQVTRIAPYFIPYVGEALMISGGAETIARSDTTIPQKVLGGVAIIGGATGLYFRTTASYDKDILKMPRQSKVQTEVIYDRTLKIQNVPRKQIIEVAGKDGQMIKIVKGGEVTTSTNINPKLVTRITYPKKPSWSISEIADESGNVLGVIKKPSTGRGLFKTYDYTIKYKVTPEGKAVYNIFRDNQLYKTVESSSGKFLGYTQPTLVDKTKISQTKVLPGKVKVKVSEANKIYAQELVPLEKTNLKITGEAKSFIRTERATILSPAKQETIYTIEKFTPKRQSIKLIETKKRVGVFSDVQPSDLQVVSGRKVKLDTLSISSGETVKAYHGTTNILASEIKIKGLVPGKATGTGQGVAGKLDDVFLTVDKKAAEGWANRAAYGKGIKMGEPQVLEVNIPKPLFEAALKRQGGVLPGGEIRLGSVSPEMIGSKVSTPKVSSMSYVTTNLQTPRFKDIVVQSAGGRGEFTLIEQNVLDRYGAYTAKMLKSKKASLRPATGLEVSPPGETLLLDTRVNIPTIKTNDIGTTQLKIFLPKVNAQATNFGIVGLVLPQTMTKTGMEQRLKVAPRVENSLELKQVLVNRLAMDRKVNLRQELTTVQTKAMPMPITLTQPQTQVIRRTETPLQLRRPTQPPETPRPRKQIPPFALDLGKGMKTKKDIALTQNLIEIFARRRGKDIKFGEAFTGLEAGKILSKRLKGTLAASGFARAVGGNKLSLSELGIGSREFGTAKRDTFRVVQQRGFRLGTRSEVSEIKLAKKGKRGRRILKIW